jgi:hypothetical protein
MASEALNDLIDSMAPKEAREEKTAVNEEILSILKYESQQGIKLGEFEVAYKQTNVTEKFQNAFEVLSKSNATIQSRYHGKEYVYSYWLFGEGKIYRQKLKEKA